MNYPLNCCDAGERTHGPVPGGFLPRLAFVLVCAALAAGCSERPPAAIPAGPADAKAGARKSPLDNIECAEADRPGWLPPEIVQVFGSHRFAVNGFDPKAALIPGGGLVASATGDVALWDMEGRQLAWRRLPTSPRALGFSGGDTLVAVMFPSAVTGVTEPPQGANPIRVWRVPGLEPVSATDLGDFSVECLAISARTPLIALSRTVSYRPLTSRVRLVNTNSWEVVAIWDVPLDLRDVVFSPEGKELALVAEDRVILRPVSQLAEPKEVRIARGAIGCLAYSLDGRHVALSDGFGVSLRDRSLGSARYIRGPTRDVFRLARHFNKGQTPPIQPTALRPPPIQEAADTTRTKDRSDPSRESRRSQQVTCVALSPDGRKIYCALNFYSRYGDPFAVEEYDTVTGELRWIRTSVRSVKGIAPSPDGKFLLVWGYSLSRRLDLVPLDRGRSEHPFVRFYGRDIVVISRDGRSLARAADNYRVEIWDVRTGRRTRSVRTPLPGEPVAFGGDGQWFTAVSSRTIHILAEEDAADARAVSVGDEKEIVRGSAVTRDGRYGLLILEGLGAGKQGRLRRYRLPQWELAGEALVECEPTSRGWYGKQPSGMAISPDGRLVAVGTDEASVIVYDAQTMKPLRELACPPKLHRPVHYVARLDFSPDGKLLAATTRQGPVHVWRAASGEKAHTLDSDGLPSAVRFGPSNRWLLVGGYGIQVWDLSSPDAPASELRLRTRVTSISEPISREGATWVALGCSNGLAYLAKLGLPER